MTDARRHGYAPSLSVTVITAAALFSAGCGSAPDCPAGSERREDPTTGMATCVDPSAVGIPCDLDGGARLVGGVCVGDPAQFPTCGAGTLLDPASNSCQPVVSTVIEPPPCPTQDATHFCVNGVVRFLRDGSYVKSQPFEVRSYNPLQFLANPKTAPLKTTQTDGNGTYVLSGLTDASGQGLAALAVIDSAVATDGGMVNNYILSGSGKNMIKGGQSVQVDLYAVENTLIAGWDTSAGLAPGTLEGKGCYLVRFYDKPAAMEDSADPASGIVITANGALAKNQWFFQGDYATLAPVGSATATDAMTGAALLSPGSLGSYSGMGGGFTWESGLGGSAKGVVFIQKFHPTM